MTNLASTFDGMLTEEQIAVRDLARQFAAKEVMPIARTIDRDQDYSVVRRVYESMGSVGFFGHLLPNELGGSDGDTLCQALIQEELAFASGSIANLQAMAIEEAVTFAYHASPSLRDRYLPGIVAGTIMPAFALTEPNAGSDASAIETRALPVQGGYRISGTKAFVTAGAIADIVIVIAVTDVQDHRHETTAFVIDRSADGLEIGRTEDLHGVRGTGTAQLQLDNCFVSEGQILGERGHGLRLGLTTIDLGRISTAAMALGIGRAALESALDYSVARQQFNQEIFGFQSVQFQLVDMVTELDAARLITWAAARARDRGGRFSREASEAKLFATEVGSRVAEKSMLLFGGVGYSRELDVERYVRDSKLCQIFEGTNNIQRLVLARELRKAVIG